MDPPKAGRCDPTIADLPHPTSPDVGKKSSGDVENRGAMDFVENELHHRLNISEGTVTQKEDSDVRECSDKEGDKEDLSCVDEINNGWNDAVDVKDEWNGAGEVTGWGDEFKDENSGKGDTWSGRITESGDKVDEAIADYDVKKRNVGYKGIAGFGKLPVRPGAEDCAFYLKTGVCKFGSACKFNHPHWRKFQDDKVIVKGKGEGPEQSIQIECKYYMNSGGCKYGSACKFLHANGKASAGKLKPTSPPELNALDLPIRPGEKECPYYMRNGSCKFGCDCRFHHPHSAVAVRSDSNPSHSSPWYFSKPSHHTVAYVPIMIPQKQDFPSRNPQWHKFRSSGYPQESGDSPATTFNNSTIEIKPNGECKFPERPGQPDCSHYLKTGECKFRSNCKYHHPKDRISQASSCNLSDKGLPLRPDQNVCAYYSRYGICKFGPACKFNHPIQQPPNPYNYKEKEI